MKKLARVAEIIVDVEISRQKKNVKERSKTGEKLLFSFGEQTDRKKKIVTFKSFCTKLTKSDFERFLGRLLIINLKGEFILARKTSTAEAISSSSSLPMSNQEEPVLDQLNLNTEETSKTRGRKDMNSCLLP